MPRDVVEYKNIIGYVVKELVENPNSVYITEKIEDSQIVLTIQVDARDRGILIGREGKNIRAIRGLANAISSEDNRNLIIEISE